MVFDLAEARPFPKMEVSWEKCTVPLTCKKCFEVCPHSVFLLVTIKNVKFVETNINEPNAYLVKPQHIDRCTGCMECVKACPSGAIKVRFAEEVEQ